MLESLETNIVLDAEQGTKNMGQIVRMDPDNSNWQLQYFIADALDLMHEPVWLQLEPR